MYCTVQFATYKTSHNESVFCVRVQESEEENAAYEQRVKQLEVQLVHDDQLAVTRLERDLEGANDAALRLHAQVDVLQVLVRRQTCIPADPNSAEHRFFMRKNYYR